jgi:hypothetical protein
MHRMWMVTLWVSATLAQTPVPPAKPPAPANDPGVFRLPSAFPDTVERVEPKPPEAPKPVVLENHGKPIRIPITCTDEDITAIGMTCTVEEPCAVYFDLSAVYGLDSRIYLAGNLHNGAVTMFSLLLMSEDNGKTFTEPFERLRNGGLDRIQFFDKDTGWVSGGLLLALPRDPFFLLTTDGGQTWRKRPVFSESKLGIVDQFSFQSKTAGAMLVDRGLGAEGGRYEHYESMTGGDSWTVREVSNRPAPVKPPPPPAADWRFVADAKLKAHSVERKVGERWQRVATFAIQVGECRPTVNPVDAPAPAEQIPEVSNTAPVDNGPMVIQRPSKPPTLKKPR